MDKNAHTALGHDGKKLHSISLNCAAKVISKKKKEKPFHFCEAQARVRQGWARDGPQGERPPSKLKPLPRAYIKVGCHPPPPPKV